MINNKERSTKVRGGGFPSVDLEEALEMIKMASAAGWDMPRETFASSIHSSSNSGPFLGKLAALRDFGLIERGDRIKLTPIARALIAPVSEDKDLHKDNLQKAFFSCDVFKSLYEKLKETSRESSLEVIANLGMHEFRVSPKRKIVFARNFFESGRLAGLLSGDGSRLRIEASAGVGGEDVGSMEGGLEFPGSASHVTKGKFKFQDSGTGWELFISTSSPLNSVGRQKILDLIEALDTSNT